MRLKVLTVAGRAPQWIEQGWQTYANRMPPHLSMELQVIEPVARGKSNATDKIQQTEAAKLLAASDNCHRIALHERGRQYTTRELANQIESWQHLGQDVAFLIGGADGLHSSLLQCTPQWSLAKLTLPHLLVRVILAEQLYRAYSITINHPYHRD